MLAHNQDRHRCSFWTLRGVISNQGHLITLQSYGTRAGPVRPEVVELPQPDQLSDFLTLQEVQLATNLTFTTLLIDCEGCIESLFLERSNITSITGEYGRQFDLSRFRKALASVRTIILEADMGHIAPDCFQSCVRYDVWQERFQALGFTQVLQERDAHFWFIDHFVFQR